jgi:hypothetical protein
LENIIDRLTLLLNLLVRLQSNKKFEIFCFYLGEASSEFLTLCIVLLGTSCVFGTIIYTIERTTNPESTILYPNVGNGVYYAILAITNVGFEGFLPTTYLGKWIACIAITIGLLTSIKKKFFSFINILLFL